MKIKRNWNRGAWTGDEDKRLLDAIATYGYRYSFLHVAFKCSCSQPPTNTLPSWTSVSEAVGNRSPDRMAPSSFSFFVPTDSEIDFTEPTQNVPNIGQARLIPI